MKYSIIMPVKNEEDNIRKAVQILFDQTFPPDEIIVVDAGSTDNTLNVLQELQSINSVLKIIKLNHAYPGAARNAGIRQAKNEIILMIDAGVYAGKNWAEQLLIVMKNNPDTDVVFGRVCSITNTFFEKCCGITMGFSSFNTVKMDGIKFKTHAIPSSAIRKRVWENVGGFLDHVYAAEDFMFISKIKQGNYRIRYAPEAKIHWLQKQTFKEIFRVGIREGRDLCILKIQGKFILKLVIFNSLLLVFAVMGTLLNYKYFLCMLSILLLRLVQRLHNSWDISRTIIANPLAFIVISYMIVLHSIGVVIGYFKQILREKHLK
jgi:glycosyltransferase involved in cell wall biosynthesis